MLTNQNENQKEIEELKRFIATAEENLESARTALSKLTGEDINFNKNSMNKRNGISYNSTPEGKIIEGVFNGEDMLDPEGNIFPVPANYASKSKLIEGDRLKLTIAEDGSFIFKQIGPAARKKVIGTLESADNAFHVTAEGKNYNVLFASVTYFKAKPNDRVTIVIPSEEDSHWGAIENVIHDVGVEKEEEDIMVGLGEHSNTHNGFPNFLDTETENKSLEESKVESKNDISDQTNSPMI